MIIKEVSFGEEAKERLLSGVNKIANAVKSTLGAQGQTVLIESENHTGGVTITKDGVTVAKSIHVLDPAEDLAIRVVREASVKTATEAGDGTTTAIVLTQAIIQAAIKRIKPHMNNTTIIRHMQQLGEDVCKQLDKMSKKVTSRRLIDVATISSNNDKEIGKIISSTYEKVGKGGVVLVENADGSETTSDTTEGMRIERGFSSRYFINNPKLEECVLTNPKILCLNTMIESIGTIEHVLADVMKQNQSLLIIGELDPKVLNTLNLNKIRNGLKVCAIKPPNFGWKKDDLMEDIARATGATCFTEEAGDAYQMVRWDDLGTADKVVVNHENTIVVLNSEQQSNVATAVEELWDNMETAKNKEFIKERIATISGKIGVIYVGANSDIEQKEKRDRVDDAVCATRAALEEGILPGGGVALKQISDDLAKRGEGESQRVASLVLCEALKSPFYQILINAGLDPKQIEKCLDPGIGYDVKNDKYGNMFKMGIIDPTKVTKSAVLNAISVASTFLSTNAIITNVREK
tara:strand:+ start:59 stop:1621 length:1563 start_codon:yes stop_codon:yes gene_type:complete